MFLGEGEEEGEGEGRGNYNETAMQEQNEKGEKAEETASSFLGGNKRTLMQT